jgi:hypothetical protein
MVSTPSLAVAPFPDTSMLLPLQVTVTAELSSYPTSRSFAVNSLSTSIVDVVEVVADTVSVFAVSAEEVSDVDELLVLLVLLLVLESVLLPLLHPVNNNAVIIRIDINR